MSIPASGSSALTGVADLQIGGATASTNPAYGSGKQKARSWLEYRHPEYVRNIARWTYARDHYQGEVLEPTKLKHYLIRRVVGESDKNFSERCKLADYTNHLATVVDSIAGMIFAVESDANRRFTDDDSPDLGLGDPEDPDSPIGELWQNADPDGTGWLTVWKGLATELMVCHTAWVLVDKNGDMPSVRVLPATAVPSWRYGKSGRLEEVLVEEEVDTRTSLQNEPSSKAQYCHFTTTGWQRYELSEEGAAVSLSGGGNAGVYAYEGPGRQPDLPIFRVSLPMKRPAGYLLAKKCNAIFNRESDRDNLLRVANFPKLVLSGQRNDVELIMADLEAGANILHSNPANGGQGHEYITPPTEAAAIATEVLKRKVEEFYITAFREYSNAAKEKTATEVRQDVSSGIGALLQLLAAALDDGENGALWRIEQMLEPTDRRFWFVSRVTRTEDFLPADPDAVIDRQSARVFGTNAPVPMGLNARLEAARIAARHQGLPIDDVQLEAAVKCDALSSFMAQNPGLELPAEVRADHVMTLLTSIGLVDNTETVLADGTKTKRADAVRAAVMKLTEAADVKRRRESENFPSIGEDDADEKAA